MGRRGRALAVAIASAAVAALAASAVAAENGDIARASGVQLTLPSGWSKVVPARSRVDDPRTLLVIGTDGVRAVESDCQVATYRVPAEGAVVVVVGWRDSVGGSSFLPLSAMKLRRGTFECFAGRGAVGRVTRRDRDFQVNVMVGDRASGDTVADALEAARSLGVVPRA